MISISHLYPNLSAIPPGVNSAAEVDGDEVQNAQLNGFEKGYQAGWEDAVIAKNDEREKLTSALVQNIQDMSFTYEEAYAKLADGMKPLLLQLASTILPKFAHESLLSQLADQIEILMTAQSENLIELVVSLDQKEIIEIAIKERIAIPFHIYEEVGLASGQVYLRVNDHERIVDVASVLTLVSEAMHAYFKTLKEELKYG